MTSNKIAVAAFFVFLGLISLQLFGVFRLFLMPILWAVILAITVFPVYRVVLRLLRGRKNSASFLVTLAVFAITAGPLVFFSGRLAKEALEFYGKVNVWVQSGEIEGFKQQLAASPLGGVWRRAEEKTDELNIELVPWAVKFLRKFGNGVVGHFQEGAKNFFFFVFRYAVVILALFFFLRDGSGMAQGIEDVIPLSREDKEVILRRMEQTISAVVRGVGLTGITQGILAGFSFWALGVPYPLFLGLLTAFLAFVPFGGAAMLWLPASGYLYWQGFWGKALVLVLWGVLVISLVDNFLKPILIGEKTKLPTLFLFFSIMGGIMFYGFIGLFLGPVLLTLFLTLIQIYRKEYAS